MKEKHIVQEHFYCTSYFLVLNYFRILWHFVILLKTLLDEILSGYVISRGVALDTITIICTPFMLFFSLLTDFKATDLRTYLLKAMNISYEVNDFTLLTASYRSLLDSCHSLQINAAIYFLITQKSPSAFFCSQGCLRGIAPSAKGRLNKL